MKSEGVMDDDSGDSEEDEREEDWLRYQTSSTISRRTRSDTDELRRRHVAARLLQRTASRQ